MAIDENVLFQTIYQRNPNKSVEDVMKEVVKAKNAYEKAEQSATNTASSEEGVKRLTRRSLKFDPDEAIQDEYIQCCLCGEKLTNLNKRHLARHHTNPEEYRRVCGYDPKQPLMSRQHMAHVDETIKRAQEGRRRTRNQG